MAYSDGDESNPHRADEMPSAMSHHPDQETQEDPPSANAIIAAMEINTDTTTEKEAEENFPMSTTPPLNTDHAVPTPASAVPPTLNTSNPPTLPFLPPELLLKITRLAAVSGTSFVIYADFDDEDRLLFQPNFTSPMVGKFSRPGICVANSETHTEVNKVLQKSHTLIQHTYEYEGLFGDIIGWDDDEQDDMANSFSRTSMLDPRINSNLDCSPYHIADDELVFYANLETCTFYFRLVDNIIHDPMSLQHEIKKQKSNFEKWLTDPSNSGKPIEEPFTCGKPLTNSWVFDLFTVALYYPFEERLDCLLSSTRGGFGDTLPRNQLLEGLLSRIKHVAVNLCIRPYDFDIEDEANLATYLERWAEDVLNEYLAKFIQDDPQRECGNLGTVDLVIPEKSLWDRIWLTDSPSHWVTRWDNVPYKKSGVASLVDWKTKKDTSPWMWIYEPKVLEVLEKSLKNCIELVGEERNWTFPQMRLVVAEWR